MKYFEELKKSMNYLAKDKRTIFLGQAVKEPGTAMSNTLKEINSGEEKDIMDPVKLGITVYRKTLEEIEEEIIYLFSIDK